MFNQILNLFYPNLCVSCEQQLYVEEKVLCINCKSKITLLEISDYKNNEISNLFYGKTTVQKAYSFLYYRKKSIAKKLTSNLKYNNRQDIGVFLGNWFGLILKEKKVFDDIDIIICVPLHKKKLKKRGYNQINKFAKTLSIILNKPYSSTLLIRNSFTKTQTQKNRLDRFLNMKNTFELTNIHLLENKHVLLIDDVITTGATLYACCNELSKTKNINISIATIAFTEQN